MPIVVDLSGDGNAQILVSGAASKAGEINDVYIRRYVSSTPGAWAPARKVWHQHGYNGVNINEDLTVPRFQLHPSTVFSGPNGILGDSDDVRPYNGFLMQQTNLSAYGVPIFLLPNAKWETVPAITISSNTATIAGCIVNIGDAALQPPIYVTFYKNDTITANIIKVDSLTQNIHAGDTLCFSFSLSNLCEYAPMSSVWISINDKGGVYPYQQQCMFDGRRKVNSTLAEARDTLSASITASAATVCVGVNVTFTAAFSGVSNVSSYQWKKNGVNVGSNSSTYDDNTLNDGDVISCVVTSANPCTVQNPFTTNTITMTITPTVVPSVTITAAPQ
jgi:hypothetical protein